MKNQNHSDLLHNLAIGTSTFLGIIFTGFLLLCLVRLLPSGRITMHVRESAEMIDPTDLYVCMVRGDITTKQDSFTDAIMLLAAAYDGSENPVDKTINNYFTYKLDATKQESLRLCGILSGEEQSKQDYYSRYWMGFIAFLRPLLLFLNLNEIRLLNLFLIIGALCLLSVLLYYRKRGFYVIPLILTYCYINPLTVSASLQYSTVFWITTIALLVLLVFYPLSGFQKKIWLYFMVIGMTTSYFDFLTYPIVSLGLPLIVFLLLSEHLTFYVGCQKLFTCSALWGFGYAGMWSSKWLLSSVLTQKDYFASAIAAAQIRISSSVPANGSNVHITYKDVCSALYSCIEGSSLKYIFVFIIFTTVILLLLSGINYHNIATSFLILIIAVYPFIWIMGVKNHSYVHSFFVYRILSITILSFSVFLMPLIDCSSLKEKPYFRFLKKLSLFNTENNIS